MRVEWTDYADSQKEQIADYIRERFGLKYKRFFIREVDRTAQMLMRSPNIGTIDPLFDDRTITYRSIIINGLSKMVYYIKDDTIYIAAFWDTRREPNRQREQTIARNES